MLPLHAGDKPYKPRLRIYEKVSGWLRLIWSDASTRNLFMFLCLNLTMAFVELLYGMWTNSLGLISDSFHMFFDCTALLAGLAASVVAKWRANEAFSYGYVRIEILAGFVNGLFLMFIAFFIFSEAVERLFEPPEVHHERLFIISVMGFLVNIVGIFAFHHGGHGHSHGGGGGHGHSHGSHSHGLGLGSETKGSGHSHKHDHGDHGHRSHPQGDGGHGRSHSEGEHGHSHHGDDHGHSHEKHGHSHEKHSHNHEKHSHSHEKHGHSHEKHGHSHVKHDHDHSCEYECDSISEKKPSSRSRIFEGVFLHILADTLGSVGVIISSALIHMFGWMIADPICSMFIAILIGMSVIPLLRDSIGMLLQRTPRELDDLLPSCYQRVSQLEGVYSVHEPHFWTLCSDVYVGTVKVEVAPNADARYILSQTHNIFTQVGVRQLYVQIDYAQA